MRTVWLRSSDALRNRMLQPQQVDPTSPQAEMPPYMESFLAHLRLLVGVPFEYLVPDSRLLPDESIRFFYLDRSWTDRLVDGLIAVGKMGTREQAHHQAHAPAVSQQVDITERLVRDLQRTRGNFPDLKQDNDRRNKGPAQVVTGFLLRSAAVSGWPHMDVRAYSEDLPEPLAAGDPAVLAKQLRTLRLEILSPSVVIALFEGIPALVILEEPHHGVRFAVQPELNGFFINLRVANGELIHVPPPPLPQNPETPVPLQVPVRAANNRVVAVAALRKLLNQQSKTYGGMPAQQGSADFAVEVLNPPWRQRFEGTTDYGHGQGSGGFVGGVNIAVRVTDQATQVAWRQLIASPPINPGQRRVATPIREDTHGH
jgi:hypothetical protein